MELSAQRATLVGGAPFLLRSAGSMQVVRVAAMTSNPGESVICPACGSLKFPQPNNLGSNYCKTCNGTGRVTATTPDTQSVASPHLRFVGHTDLMATRKAFHKPLRHPPLFMYELRDALDRVYAIDRTFERDIIGTRGMG